MYNRTIWKDDVPGVQEGTDMNAANFNNMEAGIMEANALAAMNAAYRRYEADEALNREIIAIDATLTGTSEQTVAIPTEATRRGTDYNVGIEIKSVTGGTAGDVIITTKQANGVKLKYNGTASSIAIRCKVSGGMI